MTPTMTQGTMYIRNVMVPSLRVQHTDLTFLKISRIKLKAALILSLPEFSEQIFNIIKSFKFLMIVILIPKSKFPCTYQLIKQYNILINYIDCLLPQLDCNLHEGKNLCFACRYIPTATAAPGIQLILGKYYLNCSKILTKLSAWRLLALIKYGAEVCSLSNGIFICLRPRLF